MRKYFIDNLRTICILLLFPFHTAMIYNNWGEAFYINGSPKYLPSLFNTIVYPWWMTLLFVIAGISSYYALSHKTSNEYAKERVHKLLVPLLVGFVIIIPVQSYIADMFHNNYMGGYFRHYQIYFTHVTDFTGSDGGFTPGHLWFILYLFVISIIMLPFMKRYQMASKRIRYENINLTMLILLFVIVLICTPILEIGKSVGEFLACFALGYFILSSEVVQQRLQNNKWILGCMFLLLMAIRIVLWNCDRDQGIVWDIEYRIYSWTGILFFIGFGRSYLNRTNKVLKYLSNASFSLYYFHQTILIVIGYLVVKYVKMTWLQFLIIMIGTVIISLCCYEILRRNSVTSYLFGMKYKCRSHIQKR